jgi:hypothetical protein
MDPVRIENGLASGTPDVNYVEGWVELKHKHEWPVRQQTPLTIDHFTTEQRVWLKRRWHRGGQAWLLLRVDRAIMLFDGWTAGHHVGLVNREALHYLAAVDAPQGLAQALERGLFRLMEGDMDKMEAHERLLYMRLRCMQSRETAASNAGIDPGVLFEHERGRDKRLLTDLLCGWES